MRDNPDRVPGDPAGELEASKRRGEEAIGERSTPQNDFRSAIAIGAFCLWAIVLAAQLDLPTDNVWTAPGLLPIVTAGSMLLMAIGLGVGAWRQAGRGVLDKSDFGTVSQEFPRAILVMGIVLAYIVAVDFVNFEWRYNVNDDLYLAFSSFEAMTIAVLTLLLRMFWKAPVLRCIVVSTLFTVGLANTFRFGFLIPMPGSY